MYKSVVFDLDGTLIDTDELVLKIYKQLVKKFPPNVKLQTIDQEILLSKNYKEVLKELYSNTNDDLITEIYKIHQDLVFKNLKIYPNIIKTLEALKERGIKLYCFTSELRHIAITELVGLSIYHFFDEIIAFEDVERPKPDPEGLLKLALRKRLNKHEMLFVGNSIIDGQAGKQAGIKTAFLNHHFDESKAMYFDEMFENTSSLVDYIKQYEPAYRLSYNDDGYISILQLTDLHLMDDERDIHAKKLMDKLIKKANPDLICFTGDQTMSKDSPKLYEKLKGWVEAHKIPWTLVFGNHDTDFDVPYEALLEPLKDAEYFIFNKGLSQFGFGNFFIELRKDRKTKGLLFFLDSHKEDFYMIENIPTWGYGSLKENQLKWYAKVVNQYHFPYEKVPSSLMFFHIPPYEFRQVDKKDLNQYEGEFEETPQTPPVNNNLMKYITSLNSTKGLFVGHDHYNDFSFYHNSVLFAYGRVSGYYEYGRSGFAKGGRLIKLHKDGILETKILTIGRGTKKED